MLGLRFMNYQWIHGCILVYNIRVAKNAWVRLWKKCIEALYSGDVRLSSATTPMWQWICLRPPLCQHLPVLWGCIWSYWNHLDATPKTCCVFWSFGGRIPLSKPLNPTFSRVDWFVRCLSRLASACCSGSSLEAFGLSSTTRGESNGYTTCLDLPRLFRVPYATLENQHTVDGSEIWPTSWCSRYPSNSYRVLYIPGGGGFLPSTWVPGRGIPFGKQHFQGPFYFSSGRYQHLGGLAACFFGETTKNRVAVWFWVSNHPATRLTNSPKSHKKTWPKHSDVLHRLFNKQNS